MRRLYSVGIWIVFPLIGIIVLASLFWQNFLPPRTQDQITPLATVQKVQEEGYLYLSSEQGITKLDLRSGQVLWQYRWLGHARSPFHLYAQKLYMVEMASSSEKITETLLAIDTQTGKVVIQKEFPSSSLLASTFGEDTLYRQTGDPETHLTIIQAFSLNDGSLLWQKNFSNKTTQPPPSTLINNGS